MGGEETGKCDTYKWRRKKVILTDAKLLFWGLTCPRVILNTQLHWILTATCEAQQQSFCNWKKAKQNKKLFLEDMKWLTQLAVDGIGHAPRTSLHQSHILFSALPQAEGLGSKDLWMRAGSSGLPGKGILAQIPEQSCPRGLDLGWYDWFNQNVLGLSKCQSLKKWRWIRHSPCFQESHSVGKQQIHMEQIFFLNHSPRCVWAGQK